MNVLSLINDTKKVITRNEEWEIEELISKVIKICNKHDIDASDMDLPYAQRKKFKQHSSTFSIKAIKSSNFSLKNINYLLKSFIYIYIYIYILI